MGAEVTVRITGDHDVGALLALRRADTEEQHGPVDDPEFADRFTDWYRSEASRRVFWIAAVDDIPVGTANLVVFRRMPRPGRETGGWGYLGNAFVAAPHRNHGVGRRLLDAIVDYADADGLERIVLNPTDRSVPFYRRAGFGPASALLLRPQPRAG